MSEDRIFSVKTLNAKLAHDLSATFDGIAKIGMRASAELSDLENNPGVLENMQQAHATVTLIIDDAMRGLREASTTLIGLGMVASMESQESEGIDSSSQ